MTELRWLSTGRETGYVHPEGDTLITTGDDPIPCPLSTEIAFPILPQPTLTDWSSDGFDRNGATIYWDYFSDYPYWKAADLSPMRQSGFLSGRLSPYEITWIRQNGAVWRLLVDALTPTGRQVIPVAIGRVDRANLRCIVGGWCTAGGAVFGAQPRPWYTWAYIDPFGVFPEPANMHFGQPLSLLLPVLNASWGGYYLVEVRSIVLQFGCLDCAGNGSWYPYLRHRPAGHDGLTNAGASFAPFALYRPDLNADDPTIDDPYGAAYDTSDCGAIRVVLWNPAGCFEDTRAGFSASEQWFYRFGFRGASTVADPRGYVWGTFGFDAATCVGYASDGSPRSATRLPDQAKLVILIGELSPAAFADQLAELKRWLSLGNKRLLLMPPVNHLSLSLLTAGGHANLPQVPPPMTNRWWTELLSGLGLSLDFWSREYAKPGTPFPDPYPYPVGEVLQPGHPLLANGYPEDYRTEAWLLGGNQILSYWLAAEDYGPEPTSKIAVTHLNNWLLHSGFLRAVYDW